MFILEILATTSTPAATFNNEKGELHVYGRSLEKNADLFYTPLLSWVDEYIKQPCQHTTLRLNIEYSNTPSIKCLFSILKKLKSLNDSGRSLTVKWEYDPDDEDMLLNGQVYSQMLQIPFEYIKQ